MFFFIYIHRYSFFLSIHSSFSTGWEEGNMIHYYTDHEELIQSYTIHSTVESFTLPLLSKCYYFLLLWFIDLSCLLPLSIQFTHSIFAMNLSLELSYQSEHHFHTVSFWHIGSPNNVTQTYYLLPPSSSFMNITLSVKFLLFLLYYHIVIISK